MNNDGRHSVKLSAFAYERLRNLAQTNRLSLTRTLEFLILDHSKLDKSNNGNCKGIISLKKEVGELREQVENKEHTYHLVTREKEV